MYMINRPYNENMGQAFGRGLQSGLEKLANEKLEHIRQAGEEKKYQREQVKLERQQEAQIDWLSRDGKMSRDDARAAVATGSFKDINKNIQTQAKGEALGRIFSGAPTPPQTGTDFLSEGMQKQAALNDPRSLVQPQTNPALAGETQKVEVKPSREGGEDLLPPQNNGQNQMPPNNVPPQQNPVNPMDAAAATTSAPAIPNNLPPQRRYDISKISPEDAKYMSVQDWVAYETFRQNEINNELAKEKISVSESNQAYELNKKYIEDIENEGQSAIESKEDSEILRTIINKGEIAPPEVYKGLKLFGLDFGKLVGADTELVVKIANHGIRELNTFFKGKVNEAEFKEFMKMILSPTQSYKSQMQFLAYRDFRDAIALRKNEAYNEIMNATGWKTPRNLKQLMKEKMGDYPERAMKAYMPAMAGLFIKQGKEGEGKKNNKSAEQQLSERQLLGDNQIPNQQQIQVGVPFKGVNGKNWVKNANNLFEEVD